MRFGNHKTVGQDPNYFSLLEAMNADGCVVCRLADRQLERIIDSLRYERIDDYEIRRKIHQSGGFCREHALRILEQGDPLLHAIIYSRLCEQKVETLRSGEDIASRRSSSDGRKRFGAREGLRAPNGSECLICEGLRELEDRVLPLIPMFYDCDETFRKAFDERGHLCVPHLEAVFSKSKPDASPNGILSAQIRKYDQLARHLREIERKFDYRYCNETSCEDEKKAWRLAVALWTGC